MHLTIRLVDGTLTLTPEWMLRPEVAGCAVRPEPRLSLACLRDLRAHLDAVLGSDDGESPVTDGADHASEPQTVTGVETDYGSDETALRVRLAALDAEIDGLKALLAERDKVLNEVRTSRDELRQDRDEWRGRAERMLAAPKLP